MPKTCYAPKAFSAGSQDIIFKANRICTEYAALGYDLTLRQLYYQFVSRGWIQNKDTEYKRLGSVINDARLAGVLDWNHLVDRTRNLVQNSHWTTPASIIRSAYASYARDKWEGQPWRVEVWVEKEALSGIVEREASRLDVPWFACRGYVSQSEMHAAALRLLGHERRGADTVIIHLGDHDPSGIDMTRDIEDRLNLFGVYPKVDRIALNMEQIKAFSPPPNPAKLTDSRCARYMEDYGDESWELDALDPTTLSDLIQGAVARYRDDDLYEMQKSQETEEKSILDKAARNWVTVAQYIRDQF